MAGYHAYAYGICPSLVISSGCFPMRLLKQIPNRLVVSHGVLSTTPLTVCLLGHHAYTLTLQLMFHTLTATVFTVYSEPMHMSEQITGEVWHPSLPHGIQTQHATSNQT